MITQDIIYITEGKPDFIVSIYSKLYIREKRGGVFSTNFKNVGG